MAKSPLNLPRLYKYIDVVGAIKTLESGRIKFTHPLQFNDPMDVRRSICHEFLDVHNLADTLRQTFISCILDHTYNPDRCPIEEMREVMIRCRASGLDRVGLELCLDRDCFFEQSSEVCRPSSTIENSWGYELDRTFVSCFTELEPSDESPGAPSQLMWAHYAEKHTGVALGYDFTGEFGTKFQKVEYSDGVPCIIDERSVAEGVLGLRDNVHRDISVRSLYCVKSLCWEYEQEWRIIAFYNVIPELTIEAFDKEALKSIYIGVNCDDAHKRKILDLATAYPNVSIYQMSIQPRSFKMRAE